MRPKVSVIIPCYNYAEYIEQCLLSVVSQNTNFNIEIIVSDDNSTDGSFVIANRFANFYQSEKFKFRILKNEINLGEIENTKKLLSISTGEYIAYLDADDYWISPNKLQAQVIFMEENKDHSMCVTGYVSLQDGEFSPSTDFAVWMIPIGFTSEEISKNNYLGCSSSRLFRNYGGSLIKDYFKEFHYSDWPLNFELSLLGKIGFIDFPSYVYRIQSKGLSSNQAKIEGDNTTQLYQKRTSILQEILSKG